MEEDDSEESEGTLRPMQLSKKKDSNNNIDYVLLVFTARKI